MTNDKPFFHPVALPDLWDVVGMVGGKSLSKIQPDDQRNTKWLKGLVTKGQMKTHTLPMQNLTGNKIALIYISEEQFTSRDLLIILSQVRLCLTAAFSLSGNSFKKKIMPDRVHRASTPRTGLAESWSTL